MNNVIRWFIGLIAVVVLAGCARTAPIDNIHTTVGAGHTTEQMKTAIYKAGVEREWIMSEAGPGTIKARQQSRNHFADVRINYTATGYSINYDSSQNLSAGGGKIHKNYNRWVHNLDKDIQLNLSALSVQ